jgi:hypothetical protein
MPINTLSERLFLISRPSLHPALRGSLCSLDRRRRTGTFCLRDQALRKASPWQACGAKNVNRFAITVMLMPERHMALLPGQVAQAKNLYCLRLPC